MDQRRVPSQLIFFLYLIYFTKLLEPEKLKQSEIRWIEIAIKIIKRLTMKNSLHPFHHDGRQTNRTPRSNNDIHTFRMQMRLFFSLFIV